jgi:hypothetical protein
MNPCSLCNHPYRQNAVGLETESHTQSHSLPPNQFVLAPSTLRPTTNIFFQLNTCGYSPYVTSSLTRGWVFLLKLLLVLASAVILRSESRRTHVHILLSEIRVLFSSPRTTRRATVEVFEPASTQDLDVFNRIRIGFSRVH